MRFAASLAIWFLATGCAPYEMGTGLGVVLLRHGEVERYYDVGITRNGPPNLFAERPKFRLTATSRPLSRAEQDALLDDVPPYQDADQLRAAASYLNRDVFPERRRLVLGSTPLIVGFDAEPAEPNPKRPQAPRLVQPDELQRRIVAAIVWPEEAVKLAQGTGYIRSPGETFQSIPRGVARSYEFAEPVTIETAFRILGNEHFVPDPKNVVMEEIPVKGPD